MPDTKLPHALNSYNYEEYFHKKFRDWFFSLFLHGKDALQNNFYKWPHALRSTFPLSLTKSADLSNSTVSRYTMTSV